MEGGGDGDRSGGVAVSYQPSKKEKWTRMQKRDVKLRKNFCTFTSLQIMNRDVKLRKK